MSRATHTTLKHYSSTPDKPLHGDCPTGRNSRCSYNRDIVTWEKTHVPIKNPPLVSVVRLMQPTFNHLGSEEFLVGCERCLDQNKNECLHHVIWVMAPVKAERVNKQTNSQTQKSRHTWSHVGIIQVPATFPHLKTGHQRVVKKPGKIYTIKTFTGIMSKKHRHYILNNKTKVSADTPLRPSTGQEECIQLILCAQDINPFEFAATAREL